MLIRVPVLVLLPVFACRFSIMFVKAVELLIPSKKKAAQGKIC
jgi:hypothetical protein